MHVSPPFCCAGRLKPITCRRVHDLPVLVLEISARHCYRRVQLYRHHGDGDQREAVNKTGRVRLLRSITIVMLHSPAPTRTD